MASRFNASLALRARCLLIEGLQNSRFDMPVDDSPLFPYCGVDCRFSLGKYSTNLGE
jgi:hypothetical protein